MFEEDQDDIYDTQVNYDYMQKYQADTDIVSTLAGGAQAAVVDFGASVWNSLPGTEEVDTYDLLQRINPNAAQIYAENPDAIQAASFIGGIFVPAGLALKGMKMLRAGAKGADWFSDAGRAKSLKELDELYRAGPAKAAEYKKAKNMLTARTIGNELVDTTAMELAILGTMSAHPFMEDYLEDPVKSFGISLALGGAIGGVAGTIANRFAVRSLEGTAQSEAWGKIAEDFKNLPEGMPYVNRIQTHQENIDVLNRLAYSAEENGLLKQYAKDTLNHVRAAQVEDFKALGKGLSEGLEKEEADRLMQMLVEDTRFQGVDAVSFMKASDFSVPLGTKALKEVKVGPTNVFQDFFDAKGRVKARAYSQEFDVFGTPHEITKISRANALGLTEKGAAAGWREYKGQIQVPDNEVAFDLLAARAPEVDALYLKRLAQVDRLKKEDLAKAAISPEDLPTLNAIVAKVMQAPEELGGIKIKLTREAPNYGAIEKAIVKASGVKANHFDQLKGFAKRESTFNLGRQNLPADTLSFLRSWTTGAPSDKATFRMAFTGYRQGGWVPNSRLKQMAKELYESDASTQLRQTLLKDVADAEGNIYLYRGTSVDNPRGHGPIDSYTPSYQVAKNFAGGQDHKVKLYKVHVDDLIGVVDNGHGELEYMVLAPARQAEASLPIANTVQAASKTNLNRTVEEVSMAQVAGLLLDKKEELLNQFIAKGVPAEVMAIRTNVPYQTVQAYMAAGGTKRLFELEAAGLPTATYGNPGKIAEYLNPTQAPLKLRVNRNKVPFAELSASLDRKALTAANQEITSRFLEISPSALAKKVGQYFFEGEKKQVLDILRAQVNEAVSSKAGSKMFQSTDFFTRNMGDFGKIATVIGKDVQHIANNAIKELVKPMTELMENITKNPAALVEANQALAFNAKLAGWRLYKDRQFWLREEVVQDGKKAYKLVPALLKGQEFKVVDDQVDKLLQEFAKAGEELYKLKNTAHQIQGIRDMPSIGFWVPPFNPKGKHIAYVHHADDRTEILWGNTEEELLNAVQTYKNAHAQKIAVGEIKVIESKGDQELYNMFTGRLDQIQMDIANIEMRHGGASAPAIVKANADAFGDIVQGYEHYIQASVRNLAELSMADITDTLQYMSKVDQLKLKNQPLSTIQRFVSGRQDAAAIMRNTLLGVSTLKNAPHWQFINQSFETVLGIAGNQLQKSWKTLTEPLRRKGELQAEDLAKLDYEKLAGEMERLGMHNPYKAFDEEAAKVYGLAKLTESKNTSKRAIYTSNALAATVALRFGEIAQPLVNAMSLPILMTSAMSTKLPEHFMGVAKGTATANPVQLMYEGVRASFSNNQQFQRWSKAWEEAGYFEPMVSEASKVLKMSREFEPGAINAVEKALDSQLVQWMSKAADSSEAMVRRVAMFTGGNLAKRLYPELSDVGVTIFAREFMDRVIGNYHAAQRPTFFQGTLGVALGLFQTYMVTMAQSMYRHLELKNYKALSKTMLAQAGIFGAGSLPGFHAVSQMIGEHYSDDNVDLVTGTFRALPDGMANLVLYGAPSSFGPAFYSRGELTPRVPGGVGDVPVVSMMAQALETVYTSVKAITQSDEETGRALLQGLSMQSISRPIARLSEVASGYSVTRQGNTIASPDEVWTTTGVLSRLLTTRPLEEAKLRDAIHLNTVYGSLDREARQKVVARLKTAIRNGTLDDAQLSSLAEEYMRTGTPTGWRSALNTAIAQTEFSGKVPLQEKMKISNPLNYMIDSLDGWE